MTSIRSESTRMKQLERVRELERRVEMLEDALADMERMFLEVAPGLARKRPKPKEDHPLLQAHEAANW